MSNKFRSSKSCFRLTMREANMRREAQEVLVRLGIDECCITNVVLSPDWRYASIYCMSPNDEDDEVAASILSARSNLLSKLLKNRCGGHFFPKLRFLVDHEARRQQKVEDLLRNLPIGTGESDESFD